MLGRWAANLDMYRKVPVDLLEGSRRGSIVSIFALGLLVLLFFLETKAFFETKLTTDLALDRTQEDRIRVKFNITMMDLRCEYATIDVISVLGKEQNVTKNVNRWTVDAKGVQRRFVHRNLLQHDIELKDQKVKETIEDLHKDGQDAIPLDPTTLEFARNEQDFLFVDFYASWCSHCRDLAPTWETLAEIMTDAAIQRMGHPGDYTPEEFESAKMVHLPVLIAKVDCVQHHKLCSEQQITGYPTLRLFANGDHFGDYYGHRTILAMTQYLSLAERAYSEDGDAMIHAEEIAKRRLNISEEERLWAEALEQTRHKSLKDWKAEDHPGCQLSGILWLNRVPGNFCIQARSPTHDLAPHMTNVSHVVHELSFSDGMRRVPPALPQEFGETITPMDGNVYVTYDLHEAYHHHLRLVSTNLMSYQVLQSSQLSLYKPDRVPEAKFILDLSPIRVTYRNVQRKWYDYVTSLMAIIGGTFTVVGMFESAMGAMSRRRQHRARY